MRRILHVDLMRLLTRWRERQPRHSSKAVSSVSYDLDEICCEMYETCYHAEEEFPDGDLPF